MMRKAKGKRRASALSLALPRQVTLPWESPPQGDGESPPSGERVTNAESREAIQKAPSIDFDAGIARPSISRPGVSRPRDLGDGASSPSDGHQQFVDRKMMVWLEKPSAIDKRGPCTVDKSYGPLTAGKAPAELVIEDLASPIVASCRNLTRLVRRRCIPKTGASRPMTLARMLWRTVNVQKTRPSANLVRMLLAHSARPQARGFVSRSTDRSATWMANKGIILLDGVSTVIIHEAVQLAQIERRRKIIETPRAEKLARFARLVWTEDKAVRPAIALIDEFKYLAKARPLPGAAHALNKGLLQLDDMPLPEGVAVAASRVVPTGGRPMQVRSAPLAKKSRRDANPPRTANPRRTDEATPARSILQPRSSIEVAGRVWERPIQQAVPAFIARGGRRSTIITLSDLSGGTGAASVTAQLGAKLAEAGDQVLVLDLDYHGALTDVCLSVPVRSRLRSSGRTIVKWLESTPIRPGEWMDCLGCPKCPGLFAVAADRSLGVWEAREKAAWLVQPGVMDVRFRLRRMLHLPEISSRFDWVLINAPSRLSTAAINAFTSSDYLVFSNTMAQAGAADPAASRDRIGQLLSWLARLNVATGACRNLSLLGVVDTESPAATDGIATDGIATMLQGVGRSEVAPDEPEELPLPFSRERWSDGVYHFSPTVPLGPQSATPASLAINANSKERTQQHAAPQAAAGSPRSSSRFAALAHELKQAVAARGRRR